MEHYTDSTGLHRMDFVVSGGGGAPRYGYLGEPDLNDYVKANLASKVQLQHLVKPGPEKALTPHHFVVLHVDGEQVSLEVFAVGTGAAKFHPYPRMPVPMQDPAK